MARRRSSCTCAARWPPVRIRARGADRSPGFRLPDPWARALPAAPAAARRPAGRASARRLDPREALAAGFAALFCEVQAGVRPRRLLRPFVTPLLQARLSYLRVHAGVPATVLGVAGSAVGPGIYEAVALVRRDGRCGAVALRLIRTPAGWRVDDVARPEDGPLPELRFPTDSDDFDGGDGGDGNDGRGLDGAPDGPGTDGLARLASQQPRRVP